MGEFIRTVSGELIRELAFPRNAVRFLVLDLTTRVLQDQLGY